MSGKQNNAGLNIRPPGQQQDKTFLSRWGDSELDDRYFTRLPGWMLFNLRWFVHVGYTIAPLKTPSGELEIKTSKHPDYGKIVGISPTEKDFMMTVMAFKFDTYSTSGAKPSMGLLAFLADTTRQTIQNRKGSMVDKGALLVEYNLPRNETDTYNFREVVRQCRAWEYFWINTANLPNPVDYAARLKFAENSETKVIVNQFIDEQILGIEGGPRKFGPQENLAPGGQENLAQRIETIRLEVNTYKSNDLYVANANGLNETLGERSAGDDDEKIVQLSLIPTESETIAVVETHDVAGEPKVTPITSEKPTTAPASPKRRKPKVEPVDKIMDEILDDEATVSTNDDDGQIYYDLLGIPVTKNKYLFEQWLVSILKCYGITWVGFTNEAARRHGHALKATKIIMDAWTDYTKLHPEIDFSDMLPETLMGDYFGKNGRPNGWFFKDKFSPDTKSTYTTLANYFMEYLSSPTSITGKRVKQHISQPLKAADFGADSLIDEAERDAFRKQAEADGRWTNRMQQPSNPLVKKTVKATNGMAEN